MLSGILDRHLNSYITQAKVAGDKAVGSVEKERFITLHKDGLLASYSKVSTATRNTQKLKSTEALFGSIKQGFSKMIKMNRGKQLVDLLHEHRHQITHYGRLLADVIADALENARTHHLKKKIKKNPASGGRKKLETFWRCINLWQKAVGAW